MSVEGMLGRRCLSTEVTMADKEIGQVFQDVACFCSRSVTKGFDKDWWISAQAYKCLKMLASKSVGFETTTTQFSKETYFSYKVRQDIMV